MLANQFKKMPIVGRTHSKTESVESIDKNSTKAWLVDQNRNAVSAQESTAR